MKYVLVLALLTTGCAHVAREVAADTAGAAVETWVDNAPLVGKAPSDGRSSFVSIDIQAHECSADVSTKNGTTNHGCRSHQMLKIDGPDDKPKTPPPTKQ